MPCLQQLNCIHVSKRTARNEAGITGVNRMVVRVFTVEVLKNPKIDILKSNAAFSCSNSELSATCGGFDRLGSFLSAPLARAFLRSTYMLPWRILTRRCPYSTSICAIFGVLWTAPFPGCFTRYYNADCVISTASLGQLSSLLPFPGHRDLVLTFLLNTMC